MTLTKIMCATDFSDGAKQAARVATRIARETGAELVIVHSWFIPPSAYSLEAPFPTELLQGVIDDGQKLLDRTVAEAAAAGVKHVTGKLTNGLPWTRLVEELESQVYDLCILGTHGRTGLSRFMLGSVAEKVVRHAPCSVLAVRANAGTEPFRHALVPTDFSESAAYALDLAALLVDPAGSITLTHVIEAPVSYSGEPPSAEFARVLDQHAAATLDREVARFERSSKVPITAESRIGYPGAQTLDLLDEDDTFDLVAMGSHGRTGIKRVLLGSVAEKVVRHARCPVLVARKRT